MTHAQALAPATSVPLVAFACPLCRSTDHMQPSQWGHHAVLICHDPPCIYARTLTASKVTPPIRPDVEASWADVVSDPPTPPTQSNPATDRVVNLLLRVGGKGQMRKLAMFLSDGKKRSNHEIMKAVGYPDTTQVATAMSRLRSRPGIHIDCLSLNKTTFYRMKV